MDDHKFHFGRHFFAVLHSTAYRPQSLGIPGAAVPYRVGYLDCHGCCILPLHPAEEGSGEGHRRLTLAVSLL